MIVANGSADKNISDYFVIKTNNLSNKYLVMKVEKLTGYYYIMMSKIKKEDFEKRNIKTFFKVKYIAFIENVNLFKTKESECKKCKNFIVCLNNKKGFDTWIKNLGNYIIQDYYTNKTCEFKQNKHENLIEYYEVKKEGLNNYEI